jgi:nucleotide-binding universal stress UspA family protein
MRRPDILLHLDTYPEPTSIEAMDQAISFAGGIEGTLTALAVQIDICVPRNRIADYLIGLSRLWEEEQNKSLLTGKRLLEYFSARAKDAGVLGDVLMDRANLYLVGEHVALRARTRDLCIVPIIDRRDGQRSVAEAVIFGSARPTLVFWPGVVDLPASAGVVIVAWDASRSAARAMADAMPVLARAKKVVVFTALNEKPAAVSGIGADAIRHLAFHGVKAEAEERDVHGMPIGNAIEEILAETRADLLVMGAYGHSKMREVILGGATEHVLSRPKVPVLLSH